MNANPMSTKSQNTAANSNKYASTKQFNNFAVNDLEVTKEDRTFYQRSSMEAEYAQKTVYIRYKWYHLIQLLLLTATFICVYLAKVDLKEVEFVQDFTIDAIVNDSETCQAHGYIVQPKQVNVLFLEKVVTVQIVLTLVSMFFLINTGGCCDHFFIGGAKPQALNAANLVISIIGAYFIFRQYILLNTYQSTIQFLLDINAKGCFGKAHQLSEDQLSLFNKYKENCIPKQSMMLVPVVLEVIIQLTQAIFLYLMCKLYGF